MRLHNKGIGGFSPVSGNYLTHSGSAVSLSVTDYGNGFTGLEDANGTGYSFDYRSGMVHALESGAITRSAPELFVLGAARLVVVGGYKGFELAANMGPQTYANFAVNSIGRDTLKMLSGGFVYRMPKFNPAYYWAKSGGIYKDAVFKLGTSNSRFNSVFAGEAFLGGASLLPQGSE